MVMAFLTAEAESERYRGDLMSRLLGDGRSAVHLLWTTTSSLQRVRLIRSGESRSATALGGGLSGARPVRWSVLLDS